MRSISLLLLVALAALGEREEKSLSRSKRRWVLSTIELEEEMNVKYPYQISTMYNDQTEGKQYEFEIGGPGVEGRFSIDKKNGHVFVHEKIDREETPSFHITFDVWDLSKGERMDRQLAFDVDIKDINDNAPVFTNLKKQANVKENTLPGDYLPVAIEARDNDQPDTKNSTVVITVAKQTPAEPKIKIKNVDGLIHQLISDGCFDYDKVKQYKIEINASDRGTPPLYTIETVELNVIDTNSHLPRFKERQYNAEAKEMKTSDNILRVAVEDKDTPHTDGWRAKYFFISGNEDGIYAITTDPKTNDGVVSVVKEKNFDITTLVNLEIGVKNIEELAICKDGKLITDSSKLPPQDSVNITVTMIDDNDPPEFQKHKYDEYQEEESEPGQVICTPKVTDVDSSNIRFKVIDDPAKWVTIDEKTGQIKTVQKMDRESPFVDENNIYKIVIAAIDDGNPPASTNCTINVHLRDINDNTPTLLNKTVIFCANRDDKIMVSAKDPDRIPYSGPFTFSLADDKTVRERWKLDHTYGEEVGIVLLKPLYFGTYSVPIEIQDQQNQAKNENLEVVVCECTEDGVCSDKQRTRSIGLGKAAIGLIGAGLLVFLTVARIKESASFTKKMTNSSKYGGTIEVQVKLSNQDAKKDPLFCEMDENNQTLIQYNQEGGGSDCLAGHTTSTNVGITTNTDGYKQGIMQNTEATPGYMNGSEMYSTLTSNITSNMNTMESQQQRGFHRAITGSSRRGTGSVNKRSTLLSNSYFRRSRSVWSDSRFTSQLERKLTVTTEDPTYVLDNIKIYEHEGDQSICQSLEELSFNIQDEDLSFLDDLDPQFKTLERIIMDQVKAKTSGP